MNPDRIRPITRREANVDELPPDWFAMTALASGMVGMLLRVRLASWAACFSCLGLVANRQTRNDWKQVACSVAFSVMGLVVNYVPPVGPPGSVW